MHRLLSTIAFGGLLAVRDWVYVAFAAAAIPGLGPFTALLLPATVLIVARLAQRTFLHQSIAAAILAAALVRVLLRGSLAAEASRDPLFWGVVAAGAFGVSAAVGRRRVAAAAAAACGGACTIGAALLPVPSDFVPSLRGLPEQLGIPATILFAAMCLQAIAVGLGVRHAGRAAAAVRGAIVAALILAVVGAVPFGGVGSGWILMFGVLLGLAEADARPQAPAAAWQPLLRRVNPARWPAIAVLLLLELLFALLLLRTPGTGDVSSFFVGWIDTFLARGLADGYRLIDSNYPPLVAVVLLAAGAVGSVFAWNAFVSFKVLLAVALPIGTVSFWRWTRDIVLTGLLAVSLLLHGVALGYLDTLFAPTFILSLRALQQRRVARFSALFAVTSLIKWQPLVILPYLAIHALSIRPDQASTGASVPKRWIALAVPAAIVLTATVAIFGVESIQASLRQGSNRNYLSGTAQNINWIFTYYLSVTDPERYGAGDGLTRIVEIDQIDPAWPWLRLMGPVFLLFYLVPLWRQIGQRASFAATIECSLAAYLSYFMLSPGVHENHLFLGTVLAAAAAALQPALTTRAILIVAMSTLNLITVYGITGEPFGFPPIVGIDVSVIFAAVNVGLFALFWTEIVRTRPISSSA